MNKRTRIILIVILLAVVAYLVYRWWQNRQGQPQGNLIPGTGSNLNSVAPELAAGSAGPSSGLNYYPGNTQLDISLPGSNEAENNNPPPVHHKPPKRKPPRPRPGGGSAGSPGTPGGGPIPVRPPIHRPPRRRDR